jgi:acetyl-CoA decarbonylase/synthase, CODH/ACS complex subunit delta
LGFQFFKESYTGKIKEITLGKGKKRVTVGGENCYPFYQFEGSAPNPPRIAMEIWDMAPEDWPEAALAPFKDVVADPAAWAKKCVNEYGADMLVLQLKSIDPNGKNASADEAAATVKKVRAAVDVPLVVWGSANTEKDEVVLKKVAEACQGENLILGPVEDKNHKGIGAAAMGFGHFVIASSPIDVNLAKQVNILLENLGMPTDRMLIDPTTGGLGYGLEYSYSVMERIRMAALGQGDDKLQLPLINNLGNEVWKSKEAKQPASEAPTLGDPERRAILMEAVGAVTYLMAGSNILIMRHPEAIRMVKSYIDLITKGGSAAVVAPIAKKLPAVEIDLLKISPAPNLAIAEEKEKKPAAAPPPKAEAAPKAAPAPAAPKAAPAPAAASDRPASCTGGAYGRRCRAESQSRGGGRTARQGRCRRQGQERGGRQGARRGRCQGQGRSGGQGQGGRRGAARSRGESQGRGRHRQDPPAAGQGARRTGCPRGRRPGQGRSESASPEGGREKAGGAGQNHGRADPGHPGLGPPPQSMIILRYGSH